MKTSTLAKIFGWLQFGIGAAGTLGQIYSQAGCHGGFWCYLGIGAQFLTALGVHHASNTNGQS